MSIAQDGHYFLTNISPPSDQIDNVNFALLSEPNGIMSIANRNGLMRYDGREWDLVNTSGSVFSITQDDEGEIYLGGWTGFGKLVVDENNGIAYQSLSDGVEEATDIFSVVAQNNRLYGLNGQYIFIYEEDAPLSKIKVKKGSEFLGFHQLGKSLLVSQSDGPPMEVDGKSLIKSSLQIPPSQSPLFIAKSLDGSRHLIVTDGDEIFLQETSGIKTVNLSDDDNYLFGSEPIDGRWLNDDLVAIATLRGGVVFINPVSEDIVNIINYRTGLPDNEVYSMEVDKDGGLWVAHEYGFTRILPSLPLKNFSHYPGIEGNLMHVASFNDRLYVSTSLGVYYLDEVKDYDEIVYYVKKRLPTPSLEAEETTEQKESKGKKGTARKSKKVRKDSTNSKKKKKGLFSFLRNKKKNSESAETTDETSVNGNSSVRKKRRSKSSELQQNKPKTRIAYEKRVKQELQSIKHVYKEVSGIESKSEQLLVFDEQLLASGLSGLFEIEEGTADTILNDPIRFVYASNRLQRLFVSSYDNELKVLKYDQEQWVEIDLFPEVNEYIKYIFEDGSNVWFCGSDKIYRVQVENDEILDAEYYEITNPYFEDTYGYLENGQVYFINSGGHYMYDQKTNAIRREKVEEKPKPERYLYASDQSIWTFDGFNWSIHGDVVMENFNSDGINILKDINSVTFDPTNNSLWIISGNRGLFKVAGNTEDLTSSHELLLKEIRTSSKKLSPKGKLNISQLDGILTFEFIQPDFSKILGVEYRYRLNGLNKKWSDWSANHNLISFPFLPPGDYELEVHTRNVLGQVFKADAYKFKIVPPYWRQPWFYALEFCFFSIMLILTFRLNSLSSKYLLLSRLLTFLTLILIIEFIQTSVESYFESKSSPVMDFFIQVGIAAMVLPVEGFLRRTMRNARRKEPLPTIILSKIFAMRKTSKDETTT
ncbi:MAG: triple tyrosine motif-containing protein [Bacteroidota bacterium]